MTTRNHIANLLYTVIAFVSKSLLLDYTNRVVPTTKIYRLFLNLAFYIINLMPKARHI